MVSQVAPQQSSVVQNAMYSKNSNIIILVLLLFFWYIIISAVNIGQNHSSLFLDLGWNFCLLDLSAK